MSQAFPRRAKQALVSSTFSSTAGKPSFLQYCCPPGRHVGASGEEL